MNSFKCVKYINFTFKAFKLIFFQKLIFQMHIFKQK